MPAIEILWRCELQSLLAEIDAIRKREIVLGEPYDLSGKPADSLRVTLVVPFGHEFSMLCLGSLALYDLINRSPNEPAIAERAVLYEALYDEAGRLRDSPPAEGFPTIETAHPVGSSDIVGLSITNPGDLPKFMKILDLAGIPVRSRDRRLGRDPIILGGNAGFANPEPLAEYVDVVALGDAEASILELIRLTYAALRRPETREELLRRVARVPGLYVPAMYECVFRPGGGVREIVPKYHDVPSKVQPQYLRADEIRASHFVSPISDRRRAMMVPNIGCYWACHFCSLGVPPYRQAPIQVLTGFVDRLETLGIEQIVISSPTFTQYSKKYELLDHIKAFAERTGGRVRTIIGSVRADELTARYLDSVASLGDFGHLFTELRLPNAGGFITIAPEFASADLVKIFNKTMTRNEVHKAIDLCRTNGHFRNVMLYFIVGVPSETEEDRLGIADYAVELFRALGGRDCAIVLKLQQFMPTVNTVSQRLEMSDPQLTAGYIERIRDRIHALTSQATVEQHFRVIWGETERLMFESICGRGDRRIGRVLEDLHRRHVDASTISSMELTSALERFGLDHREYLRRLMPDEVVPWTIVDCTDPVAERRLQSDLDARTMSAALA